MVSGDLFREFTLALLQKDRETSVLSLDSESLKMRARRAYFEAFGVPVADPAVKSIRRPD